MGVQLCRCKTVRPTGASAFAFDFDQRVFMSNGSRMMIQGQEQVDMSRKKTVAVACSYNAFTQTYSIAVDGQDPTVATCKNFHQLTPSTCVLGQCKISTLSNAFCMTSLSTSGLTLWCTARLDFQEFHPEQA